MSRTEVSIGCKAAPERRAAFRIGSVDVAGRAILAPMSGVTDLPFRCQADRQGAALVVSEMVACETLLDGGAEAVTRAERGSMTTHVVQIAGRDARWMAEGARLAEAGGADVIDINMGCPAKKVTTGLSGSALMRDLDHAMTLVEAVLGAVSVPVTLKMRLGWDDRSINAPELARRAEDAGVAMVTVHGRTRNQFYKGKADWTKIRAVREAVSIPLVVNGDIVDAASARRALTESGADAVMVGRGAYGRPWLVGAISRALDAGGEIEHPDPADIASALLDQYRDSLSLYGRALGVRVARKHVAWTFERHPRTDSAALRRTALTSDEPQEVMAAICAWFDRDLPERCAA